MTTERTSIQDLTLEQIETNRDYLISTYASELLIASLEDGDNEFYLSNETIQELFQHEIFKFNSLGDVGSGRTVPEFFLSIGADPFVDVHSILTNTKYAKTLKNAISHLVNHYISTGADDLYLSLTIKRCAECGGITVITEDMGEFKSPFMSVASLKCIRCEIEYALQHSPIISLINIRDFNLQPSFEIDYSKKWFDSLGNSYDSFEEINPLLISIYEKYKESTNLNNLFEKYEEVKTQDEAWRRTF